MQPTPTLPIAPLPTRIVLPNQFELAGKGISLSFSTTSITGQPLLHYKDARHEVNARGDEIRQVETEIGTLVTITLEPDADAGALLFTVLIPRAQLRDTASEVRITTEGVLTRSRFPRLPANAQLQKYSVVPLRGSAHFIVS
ncbi:hypothetical protein JRI60_39480 [Archangium violaceum]|uniref:hypothetical protein n=1 Tax=Archangium violaceum TaxID=83451 RepID=UPI00195104B1|nr:hypothetical protein [Archangium violaceum]QRN95114.1 hypothetical protein JRI60_39480 [Archangium violaceum]